MRIWIDLYDNSGNRLGPGPVWTVRQATISRALDGAGEFRATLSATDARAIDLVQVGRVVKLIGEDHGGRRLLGEGIITTHRLTDDPAGIGLIIDGPDILEELKRKNTLLGRIYNQETLENVCEDLIALAPGWSVSVASAVADDLVDARFDGLNVLKAFVEIANHYGLHVRSSLTTTRRLEIGPFGTDSGLRIQRVETVTPEALANKKLLMVQRIQRDQIQESNNYYNTIVPLGDGEGTAALTLAESTRNSPYPIQTVTGPDGRTLYYLSTTNYPSGSYSSFLTDPAAAVKVGQFKQIGALSNSETDIRNAANALYDAAAEELARASVVQEEYRVIVKNVQQSILPGDTVHLHYIGQVVIHQVPTDYLRVRGDYFVLRAREQIGLDSTDVELEISNVDRFRKNEGELIYDAIDQINLRTLKPNPAGSVASYVYARELAPGFPAEVPIDITDAVRELLRVRLRIKSGPFRSTSQGAEAGGDHTHAMFQGGAATIGGGTRYNYSPAGPNTIAMEFMTASPPSVLTTFGASGDHTHDPVFGITDDDVNPQVLTVWFEGANVTSSLFGSSFLAPDNSPINVLADEGALTNLLINASGGLRQLHTLEIRAGDGRGRVEVTVERFETTQTIKLS